MRRLVLFFLTTIFLVMGQQATARDDDYILSRGYFEEKTNALTIDQIENEAFTPYKDLLSAGYKASTFWLKIRLKATDQPIVIKIRPLYNEEIEIFDPTLPEVRPLVGANYPWSNNQLDGLSYDFVLPPYTSERDVYLRIKSARTYMVYVEAISLDNYQHIDRREQIFAGAYTTFALILAVGLLLTWLINREFVLGLFTLQQGLAFLHAFFHVGFAAIMFEGIFSGRSMNYVWCLLSTIYPLVAFLANRQLLSEYGLKKSYKRLYDLAIALSAIIIMLFLSGERVALMLNASLVFGAMLLFWFSALFGLSAQKATFKSVALPIVILRFYYSFNLLIWTITLIPMLGLGSSGEIALYTLYVYNILSGLIFFFILEYRARALHKLEIERSNLLELEARQERLQREEQGMLMAMLSHEIKTPLSVLKLVMDEKVAGSDLEGHANRAVSNINAIVNRCLQLGKLDAKAIRLNRTDFDGREFLATLLDDPPARSRVRIRMPEALRFHADSDILRIVLSNLIENALKYAPANSPIDIEIGTAKKHETAGISIRVRNRIGSMGAPDAGQVFKKYYRNTQATKMTGSGLGLFLVHELVAVMGGEITYTSDNEEVLFNLWIPA